MLSIGLLVHTQHLTGSYAAPASWPASTRSRSASAGPCSAASSTAGADARPARDRGRRGRAARRRRARAGRRRARRADRPRRRDRPRHPAGRRLPALAAAAACCPTRTRSAPRSPLEATAVELTWIVGPPAGLALGALWSTGAALAVAGARAPRRDRRVRRAARDPRVAPGRGDGPRPRGGSLRAPAMQTLVIVLARRRRAVRRGRGRRRRGDRRARHARRWPARCSASGAPGSLAGGLVATRLGGGARAATGLALLLGALCAGHLALAAARQRRRPRRRAAGRRRRDRPGVRDGLRDGRPRRPGRDRDRGVRVARRPPSPSARRSGPRAPGAAADHAGPAAAFVLAGGAGAVALLAPRRRRSGPRRAAERPGRRRRRRHVLTTALMTRPSSASRAASSIASRS